MGSVCFVPHFVMQHTEVNIWRQAVDLSPPVPISALHSCTRAIWLSQVACLFTWALRWKPPVPSGWSSSQGTSWFRIMAGSTSELIWEAW